MVARIPQVRGEVSQAQREDVIGALRELLVARFGSPPELPDCTDSDSLELTIAGVKSITGGSRPVAEKR
jgi:hypothetical protein